MRVCSVAFLTVPTCRVTFSSVLPNVFWLTRLCFAPQQHCEACFCRVTLIHPCSVSGTLSTAVGCSCSCDGSGAAQAAVFSRGTRTRTRSVKALSAVSSKRKVSDYEADAQGSQSSQRSQSWGLQEPPQQRPRRAQRAAGRDFEISVIVLQ